jgi:cell division initiation protein
MRLTPIEIRQHRFNVRLRGFDAHEVRSFLDAIVQDFEDVVRENAQLRREAERQARELGTYQARERNIQETLTTAQNVMDELKRTAVKEAEVVVSEAKLRGEKIIQQAREERASLEHEITELRHLRERLEADLRRTLDGYVSLIDAYRSSRRVVSRSTGTGRRSEGSPTAAAGPPAADPAESTAPPGRGPV